MASLLQAAFGPSLAQREQKLVDTAVMQSCITGAVAELEKVKAQQQYLIGPAREPVLTALAILKGEELLLGQPAAPKPLIESKYVKLQSEDLPKFQEALVALLGDIVKLPDEIKAIFNPPPPKAEAAPKMAAVPAAQEPAKQVAKILATETEEAKRSINAIEAKIKRYNELVETANTSYALMQEFQKHITDEKAKLTLTKLTEEQIKTFAAHSNIPEEALRASLKPSGEEWLTKNAESLAACTKIWNDAITYFAPKGNNSVPYKLSYAEYAFATKGNPASEAMWSLGMYSKGDAELLKVKFTALSVPAALVPPTPPAPVVKDAPTTDAKKVQEAPKT